MAGRPSTYSEEIAAKICSLIADGQSLRSICKADNMPASSTVFLWLASHKDFSEQYARARDAQAEALAEEILEISDDGTNDWMERKGEDGESLGWQLNGEHVQRSRLRVDARKWLASKLAPKKYGERLDVEHGGNVIVEIVR